MKKTFFLFFVFSIGLALSTALAVETSAEFFPTKKNTPRKSSEPVQAVEASTEFFSAQKNIPRKSSEPVEKIMAGDMLNIKVYQEQDLCGDFEVNEDGSISYPLLGAVKVGGLTRLGVENLLTQLLGADYLVNPFIQVTVKPSKKLEDMSLIMVLGSVQRPSSYPFPQDKPLSLLQAISIAGGFTPRASIADTKIIRTSPEGEKTTIDPLMDKILLGEEQDIELQRNDLVSIPEKIETAIMVLGFVQRPGSYPFNEEKPLTLLKAISLAGGFTTLAAPNGTKVIRNSPDGTKIVIDPEVNLILSGKKKDVTLQADDLISVPERFF